MNGISIFLSEELTDEIREYVKSMHQIGFTGIFTSLHIPEDDASMYLERLTQLGALAKAEGMTLMADISGKSLEYAGFSLDLSDGQIERLKQIGITGLRMDYDICNQKIAELSHHLTIGLNASTITKSDIDELKQYGANFSNFQAWHNYYPRVETGLDKDVFIKINQWLKVNGLKVFAFISGNGKLRGPLFDGLPSLEIHRNLNPLAAYLSLKEYDVENIFIGDPMINRRTINQFDYYLNQQQIILEVEDISSQYYQHVLGEHVNRQDVARDVVRSAKSRMKMVPDIHREFTIERHLGAVTIDNCYYGRYMGEIQVVKHDLPRNNRVNVVGIVIDEDKPLIELITGGTRFKLVAERICQIQQ
ncbi:MAG: MupG family TIM beta-alpha barrel fold protein [Streptococcaceae bacterium]|nr:MupG family TIM beta-alpha barrel fold protein [Streptococcaceae bacterium]